MHRSITHPVWLSGLCLTLFTTGCTGSVNDAPSGYEQGQDPATASDPQDSEGEPWMPAEGASNGAPNGAPNGTTPAGQTDGDAASEPLPGPSLDGSVSDPPRADAGDTTTGEDAGSSSEPEPVDAGTAQDPTQASIERGSGLFPALCSGCHGSDGQGGNVNVALTDQVSFDSLVNRIDDTMPKGNPSACNRSCAEDLANFILATFAR